MWAGSAGVQYDRKDASISSSDIPTSFSASTSTSGLALPPSSEAVSIGTDIDLDFLLPVKLASPRGLDVLEGISKVYIVKHDDTIGDPVNLSAETYYNVLTEDCTHLFTAVEVEPIHTGKSFIMQVCTGDRKYEVLRLSRKSSKISKNEASEDDLSIHHRQTFDYSKEIDSLQHDLMGKADSRQSMEKESSQQILVQLYNGDILGSIIKGEAGWVIVDAHAYPIYVFPLDSDEKHPTPARLDTDIIYNFYSSGPEFMTYVGSPLGRIQTEARVQKCEGSLTDHWVSYGIHYPDHLTAADKALVLTVALCQVP